MISLERYARMWRTPGVGVSFLASLPGRLPIGIAAFALVLFVQAQTGSFSNAGLVSAGYVFGLALLSPLLGRLIDRVGPKPALLTSAIGYPLALTLLVWLVGHHASMFLSVVSAALAGALLPPITVCMRALLPRLVSEAGVLQTAYSFDSIVIESIFIVGPLLVSWFVARDVVAMSVLFAALMGCVGSLFFLATPAVQAWQANPKTPASENKRNLFGPWHIAKLRHLFIVTLLYSTAFGLFEISLAAFATHAGKPAFAGALLAAASIGSAFGALIYGSHDWRWAPTQQFIFALILMALGMLIMLPVKNLYVFTVVCALGCTPMAPVLSIQSMLTSALAPKDMTTESFTWGASCLIAGLGAGTSIGGVFVEHYASQAALAAAALMVLLGAASAKLLISSATTAD